METVGVREIICPNPKCAGRLHALFWFVNAKGHESLRYRCDRVMRISHAKHTGEPIPVRTVQTRAAKKLMKNQVPADGLPEEWCKAFTLARNAELQKGLNDH